MTIDHFAILVVVTILFVVIVPYDLRSPNLGAVGTRLLICGAAVLAVVLSAIAVMVAAHLSR